MQKFLIIQTAFIGDVVLATGLLEKLHQYNPDAEIDIMVRKGNEALLREHPFIHEVLIWNKKEAKLKNLYRMLGKIRKRKYDKVINVQRFAATGILTSFSGGKETIGFDKNPFSFLFTRRISHEIQNGKHEIERNHALISHFTDSIFAKPRLYPTKADEEFVNQFATQPFITIAPASVWFTKQYPASKWIEFINRLPSVSNARVYLLGAPSDNGLCEEIRSASIYKSVENLSGRLNFLQSAALMKLAVMNYVNDSAPLHFCSAVNAPTTAVYCSTIPAFGFGPLADRSFIVERSEPLIAGLVVYMDEEPVRKDILNAPWRSGKSSYSGSW